VNQQELLALRLVSLHNLTFLLDLTAGARSAIEGGRLAHFIEEMRQRMLFEGDVGSTESRK
jgi:tRNA-guanine family transglycosylase